MMTRDEKLFNMRAQLNKAISEIDHGDTYGALLTLADLHRAELRFMEEEMPEKVLPALHAESIKSKVKK